MVDEVVWPIEPIPDFDNVFMRAHRMHFRNGLKRVLVVTDAGVTATGLPETRDRAHPRERHRGRPFPGRPHRAHQHLSQGGHRVRPVLPAGWIHGHRRGKQVQLKVVLGFEADRTAERCKELSRWSARSAQPPVNRRP